MQNISQIKKLFFLIFFTCILVSCKKNPATTPQDKTMNGVNVTIAVSTFNSYRTQGISGHPAVAAVVWNDTLSQAAYNYAKAKTEDVNTPSNIYFLSNGQFILDFPPMLNYSRSANFALYYAYPENADTKEVVDAGFASTDQTILNGLMNSDAKQFGMAQYGGKWFLIMSN